VSVTETFQLPAQPTDGEVEYIPLGGDGFTAPKFAYMIRNAAVTSDGTAGTTRVEIEMDQRYSSLVSFITGQVQQVAQADIEVLFQLSGDHVPLQLFQGDVTHTVLSSAEIGFTWRPFPIILPGGTTPTPPNVNFRVANIDLDVVRVSSLVFCFDIRVRELLPMGPLLWARGDS